jgi:hypothetical protein
VQSVCGLAILLPSCSSLNGDHEGNPAAYIFFFFFKFAVLESMIPRGLATLISDRLRGVNGSSAGNELESTRELVDECDLLLRSVVAVPLLPNAALLHSIFEFAVVRVKCARLAARLFDCILASSAVGFERWRLCDGGVPEHADLLFRTLVAALTSHHRQPELPRRARKRGHAGVSLARRLGDSEEAASAASSSDDVVEPRVNHDALPLVAEPAALEHDCAVEQLRFFATLCRLELHGGTARPTTLAAMLSWPTDDGDKSIASTRSDKRHLARTDQLVALLVGCFADLHYADDSGGDDGSGSGDDDDRLTSSSARTVILVQQVLEALVALVSTDADLLQMLNTRMLSAFNALPTMHARMLLIETLRHRAHKLLWLDFVLMANFTAVGVSAQQRAAAPTFAKFQVYRSLSYTRAHGTDGRASLRALDLYVFPLLHLAIGLMEKVADERARSVPSTVLSSSDAEQNAHLLASASPAAASQRHWRVDVRNDAQRQFEADGDDKTLIRLDLLEELLRRLASAARDIPPSAVVATDAPKRSARRTKK